MLVVEAVSTLKFKNGNDYGIVLNGSLLEDIIAEIGVGAMNNDSPNVGTLDEDDNNDVHHHHPACPMFRVQMLKSNISMLSSSDPLDMSTMQSNFVSHYCRVGGGGGIFVGSG